MKFIEFQGPMAALVSEYGGSEYGEARVQAIWRVVQHQQLSWLERVVDSLLGREKAPLAIDFENLLPRAQLSPTTSPGAVSVAIRGFCGLCQGSAWIVAPFVAGKSDPLEPPMRCECVGGPQALADTIRNSQEHPDPLLADRIEKTFAGIDRRSFALRGFH